MQSTKLTALPAPSNTRSTHCESGRAATILFVSHTGLWGGGAEVVLGQMIDVVKRHGFRVGLAAPPGNLLMRLAPRTDLAYQITLTPSRRSRDANRIIHMLEGWITSTMQLARVIRNAKADIVVANSGVAALACVGVCAVLRRPLVWHQHDIVPFRQINRLVLAPCGALATRVIAVSGAVSRSLTTVGVPSKRTTVLHNAVRPEFFEPLPAQNASRIKFGVAEDAFVVAIIGRMVPYKGHLILLEAIARLHAEVIDVTLVIAGEAPRYVAPDVDPFPSYEAEVQARASQPDLSGRILFVGQQEDVRAVLAAADVLAVPSFNEPFPLAVLEGLASGVPVVASDSGGHREAMRDGLSGLLFATGDADSLAGCLRRLREDSGLRVRLAEAGRDRARAEFSEAVFGDRLVRIYGHVVDRQLGKEYHGC